MPYIPGIFWGVNIVGITNDPEGFIKLDTNHLLKEMGVDFMADSELVYLHHHLSKRMFTPFQHCNHYAFMWKVN